MGCLDGDGPCDPAALCAEREPGRIGTPCSADADCRWACAPLAGERYLHCELHATPPVCTITAPPTLPETFGATCGIHDFRFDTLAVQGLPSVYQGETTCLTGACALAGRTPCRWQGCTVACEGDFACPPDWLCEPRQLVDHADTRRSVCVPRTLPFGC